MKKQTKITQDKTQTRSTIPKEFVDEFEVTKKDSIEWDNKGKKLRGKLVKNNEEAKSKWIMKISYPLRLYFLW